LKEKASAVEPYNKLAVPSVPKSIVIPAPSEAALFVAPLDSSMFLSSISNVVELIVVVVPSTCKSPKIITLPVISP
jgi:hypothetical protein